MSDLETFQRPLRSVPSDALTIPCTSSGQTLSGKLRRDSCSGARAGRRFCRETRGELSRVTLRRNLTVARFLPLSDPGKLAQASDRLHRRYCPQASVRRRKTIPINFAALISIYA